MSSNVREFNINIGKLKDLAPKLVIQAQKKIGLQALRGVVLRSPVKTGRFRGNWQTTTKAPATGTVAGVDPSGSGVIAHGEGVINGIEGLTIVWLTNNLAYGPALERGHSKQAPAGMVRVTAVSIRAQFTSGARR